MASRSRSRRPSVAILTPATSMSSAAVAAISSKCSGTTASACRFTPSASNGAASSGRPLPTAPWRSRPRSSATFWRGSIGVIHSEPGVPVRQADSVRGAARYEGTRIGSPGGMTPSDALPDDIEVLKRLVLARETELAQAKADLVHSRARETSAEAMIAHLRFAIEKMRRELYGQRSERRAHLLDQMEFELADLVATASEDDLAAEADALAGGTPVAAFTRKRPSRKPFPEHLPRERIV